MVSFNWYAIVFRAKHPVKVHVWAGISLRGVTGICIFEGTMDKELFAEILDKTLVPYLQKFETHRFMQDDPKHTSPHYVADFLDMNYINWWKTPAVTRFQSHRERGTN